MLTSPQNGLINWLITHLLRPVFLWAANPVLSGANGPMPSPMVCRPHTKGWRYGFTHYGIMVADLPAPHQFLACASMLGTSGMRAFDNDFAVDRRDGPRHTATLVHGTAVATDKPFTRYSVPHDMTLADDGSLIRFGNDLEISGVYPHYRLKSQRPEFAVDLALTATGDFNWFAKGAIYDHFSLLMRYRGTLTHQGQVTEVSGLCTYEYARLTSLHALVNRILPRRLKIPWDVFSFQVINLDADTQLLLIHTRLGGVPLFTTAYLRGVGQGGDRIAGDVQFKLLSTQTPAAFAPDGRTTTLPDTFQWLIRDASNTLIYEINATVDTPMLFGLGAGYVGGYRWQGLCHGQAASGRGYIEYIDQRTPH